MEQVELIVCTISVPTIVHFSLPVAQYLFSYIHQLGSKVFTAILHAIQRKISLIGP